MRTKRLLFHASKHQDFLPVRTISLSLSSCTPIIIWMKISKTFFIVTRNLLQITTLPMTKFSCIFKASLMVKQNAYIEKIFIEIFLYSEAKKALIDKCSNFNRQIRIKQFFQGTTFSIIAEKDSCDVNTPLENLRGKIKTYAPQGPKL